MLVHQEIMLRRGVSLVEGHQRWVTEGAAQHLMSALTLPFDLDNVNGLYTGSHYMNWDALGCLFLLFLCLLLVWQRQGLDKHSAKQITILGSLGLYFWNHQKRSPDYSLERHFHSQTFLCTLSKSFPVFFFSWNVSQLPHTVPARTGQFAWWLSGGHYRSVLEPCPTSQKTVVRVVHLSFFRTLSRYQALL